MPRKRLQARSLIVVDFLPLPIREGKSAIHPPFSSYRFHCRHRGSFESSSFRVASRFFFLEKYYVIVSFFFLNPPRCWFLQRYVRLVGCSPMRYVTPCCRVSRKVCLRSTPSMLITYTTSSRIIKSHNFNCARYKSFLKIIINLKISFKK